MKKMVYTSKRGNKIIFDYFVDNTKEYNTFYAEMCPHCHNLYKGILGNRASHGARGICSVDGCQKEADYYVDFSPEDVSFMRTSQISAS